MNTKVIEIKRFAVHDGDGIRTTVFFKGCPLKCVWCHNPESISFNTQIAYYENKCVSCGACASVCPANAHKIINGEHILERELCINCGKCESACLLEGLKKYGKEMSVDDLMPILLEDKEFYQTSGGGVTLSGGECLCHADFCANLLKRLKENEIHTAVDTCGLVPRVAFDMVMPYTDVFLYDVKAIDEDVHIKCTGKSNKVILDNLKYIDSCGKKIEIRIPYVPGFNDNQVEKIGEFLATLKNIVKVRVLAYHSYAGSKYESLNMVNTLPKKLPTDEEIRLAKEIIKSYGINVCD